MIEFDSILGDVWFNKRQKSSVLYPSSIKSPVKLRIGDRKTLVLFVWWWIIFISMNDEFLSLVHMLPLIRSIVQNCLPFPYYARKTKWAELLRTSSSGAQAACNTMPGRNIKNARWCNFGPEQTIPESGLMPTLWIVRGKRGRGAFFFFFSHRKSRS